MRSLRRGWGKTGCDESKVKGCVYDLSLQGHIDFQGFRFTLKFFLFIVVGLHIFKSRSEHAYLYQDIYLNQSFSLLLPS